MLSLLFCLTVLSILEAPTEVKAQKAGWALNCPTTSTTWQHPESGDVIETEEHCVKDPVNPDKERCYYLYVPPCATTNSPLAVVLHGKTGCPSEVDDSTRWSKKATENCFVTVYPWGNTNFDLVDSTCWHQNGGLDTGKGYIKTNPCCCLEQVVGQGFPITARETEDDEFIRYVINDVVYQRTINSQFTIDTKRIYLVGHSNGCAHELAFSVRHSHLIAAVGCHSGAFLQPVMPYIDNYVPVPIWMAHGKLDGDFPYEGGDITKSGLFTTLGKIKELELLGSINKCEQEVIDTTTYASHDATLMTHTSCTNGADVQLLAIDTAGHFPMSGEFRPDKEDDPNIREVFLDTTQLAWDFISQHSKADTPDLSTPYRAGSIRGFWITVLTGVRTILRTLEDIVAIPVAGINWFIGLFS